MSLEVCESCGIPYAEHLGIQWMCARISALEADLAKATEAADDWRDVAATLAVGGDENPTAAWASALEHYEATLMKQNDGGREL